MDTKEIRKLMKEQLGYNSRQVSIKQPHYSSIVFTIRSMDVNYPKVVKFSKEFEHIDYCHHTQEILSGGNTFINVSVDEKVKDAYIAKYADYIEPTLNGFDNLNDGQGLSIVIDGKQPFDKKITVFKDSDWNASIYIDNHRVSDCRSLPYLLNNICLCIWEHDLKLVD